MWLTKICVYFTDSPPDFSLSPSEHDDAGDNPGAPRNAASDELMLERRRNQAHTLYVTHFPIPNMDFDDLHEENQRNVLLFGVGEVRSKVCQKVNSVEMLMYELMREVDEIFIILNEYDGRLSKAELKRRKAHEERKLKLYRYSSKRFRFMKRVWRGIFET